MRNSLDRLDELIHVIILPNDGHEDGLKWYEKFKEEKQTFRKYIQQHCFEVEDESRIGVFIRQCRKRLIQIMDWVYLDKCRYIDTKKDQHTLILQGLHRVLAFLEDEYSNYFDPKSKMALYEVVQFDIYFNKEIKALAKKLKRTGENEIIKILFLPLFETSLSKQKLTYGNYLYINTVIEVLRKYILQYATLNQGGYSLTDVLVYLNFNSGNFFLYLISIITAEVDKEIGSGKVQVLSKFRKKLNQTMIVEDISFNAGCIHIKDWVIGWIDEEIKTFSTVEARNSGAKVKFSVSVETMGILIRACKDSNFIMSPDFIIIENFLQYCQTITGKTPTEKSLGNKIYQADVASIRKALEIIDNVRNNIKSYL
jgi:hypothetical protein